jgi:hypothetical protein
MPRKAENTKWFQESQKLKEAMKKSAVIVVDTAEKANEHAKRMTRKTAEKHTVEKDGDEYVVYRHSTIPEFDYHKRG